MTGMPSSTITLPDVGLLRQLFRYDPENGNLYYLERPDEMFSSERAANSWHTQHCGNMAGSAILKEGRTYVQIQFFKKKYLAHRIVWKMHYGTEPPPIIDHIDGDGTNNRISNLREATIYQNGWNTKKSSRNRSGYKGVSFNTERNKWRAAMRINGRDILVGYYKSREEAAAAYQKAAAAYHGDFYNPT